MGIEEERKMWWCPKCKEFPDRIIESYDSCTERRKWSQGCYEIIDVDYGDCTSLCAECDTPLIEK